MDGRKLSFQKKLSTTDVTYTLELPKKAFHLPAGNESMHVREPNGRIWQFKCPTRIGDGRRYMTQEWKKFAKTKSLMRGDILRFYYSSDEDVYSMELQCRNIRLLGVTICI